MHKALPGNLLPRGGGRVKVSAADESEVEPTPTRQRSPMRNSYLAQRPGNKADELAADESEVEGSSPDKGMPVSSKRRLANLWGLGLKTVTHEAGQIIMTSA